LQAGQTEVAFLGKSPARQPGRFLRLRNAESARTQGTSLLEVSVLVFFVTETGEISAT